MESLAQSRLASVLTLLAGIWVAISPAFITMSGSSQTSTIIVGIIIALAGLVQLFWTSTIPSWIAALAAIYLFISAFAYSVSNAATWNMAVSAIVTFILATWDGVEVNDVRTHHMAT
jgi:hypothetical protein